MIGKTERDPVIQGNNEPSGRFNLKGQQKPQYLIDAINKTKRTWEKYASEAYKHKPSENTVMTLALLSSYEAAYQEEVDAYNRWHEEQSNENN